MKLLVDARLLNAGGIGRYLRELLAQWYADDRVRGLRLIGDRAVLEPWVAQLRSTGDGSPLRDDITSATAETATKIEIEPWTDGLWSLGAQLRWLREGRRWCRGCDAVFFAHWSAPAFRHPSEPPRIVTVHDLIQFLEPDSASRAQRLAGQPLLRAVTGSAARILTVSDASAQDLERALPGIGPRLHVVPNGVSEVFLQAPDPQAPDLTSYETHQESGAARWCAELGLAQLPRFALSVGALRPHKNLSRAIEATRRAGLELWLVGPHAVEDPKLVALLEQSPHVRHLGPRDDADLLSLYRLAAVLLHPAYREGFGLPVAEALCVGTPVIASDRSSLPEVVARMKAVTGGMNVRLVDPDDSYAWVQALRELAPVARTEGGIVRGDGTAWPSWAWAASETLRHINEAAGSAE